jgi:hypothetical protein
LDERAQGDGDGTGGGWQALLADVLDRPEGPSTTLLRALTDPPPRCCEAALDAAWDAAHDVRPVLVGDLSEAG